MIKDLFKGILFLNKLESLPENKNDYYIVEKKFHYELEAKVPVFKKILDSKLIVSYFNAIYELTDGEIISLGKMRRQELRNFFYTFGKKEKRLKKKKYSKKN